MNAATTIQIPADGVITDELARQMAGDDDKGNSGGASSVMVTLVEMHGVRLWHDPEQRPWATVKISGNAQNLPLNGKTFKFWLSNLYYKDTGKAPQEKVVKDALSILAAKAIFDGDKKEINVRMAEHDGAVYIDLADENYQVVKISAAGWEIISSGLCPVQFRRPSGLAPLLIPNKQDAPNGLAALARVLSLDLTDRDQLKTYRLMLGWLLGCLKPSGPFPLLMIEGTQGSGKSSRARVLRSLIDPSVVMLRSMPREPRELFISAANSWVQSFENVSEITHWQSDCLCTLATGGGMALRTLQTNDEETLLQAKRPVMINGIGDSITRDDLADRTSVVRVPVIQKRRTEKELDAELRSATPGILAALYDVVAAGLKNLPNTTLEDLPRMADFTLWVTACEPAIGWEQGTFAQEAKETRAEIGSMMLENNIVGAAIKLLMQANPQGMRETAGDLLKLLHDVAYGDSRPPKGWPDKPQRLSNEIRRIQPALLAEKILVKQNAQKTKGHYLWNLSYIFIPEKEASSLVPPSSPAPMDMRSSGGELEKTKFPQVPPASSPDDTTEAF